jgi:serine/threonine protein kinase
MAPELLQGNGYGQATDFWAFGCLIYEMLSGQPPFMHQSKSSLYKLIKYTQPKLDYTFLGADAIDICSQLLDKNPAKRLGSLGRGASELMEHPWFQGVDWAAIEAKQPASPYAPQLESVCDVKYFDVEFTQMRRSFSSDQNSPTGDEENKQPNSVSSSPPGGEDSNLTDHSSAHGLSSKASTHSFFLDQPSPEPAESQALNAPPKPVNDFLNFSYSGNQADFDSNRK